MKQVHYLTVGAAMVVMLVLASVAIGATGRKQPATAKSLISILERIGPMTADHQIKGRFSLLLDGVTQDAGRTSIGPAWGTKKIVGGQEQNPVSGFDQLKSAKGSFVIHFSGVSIAVKNIDPTKDAGDNEYGTWRLEHGTGIYKNWSGGGRWAVVNANIEWDGNVTHQP